MYVIKRSGKTEPVKYDKITERNLKIAKEIWGNNIPIDVAKLSQNIIQGLKSGMTTTEIDELSAETATHMSTYEPEYDRLASCIAISNLHKSTEDSFIKTMRKLNHYASNDGRKFGLISDDMFKFMSKHKEEIEKAIDYKRDFQYTYFGFKTLEKAYLLRIDGKVVERPQHMLMRCAIGIHGPHECKTFKKVGNRYTKEKYQGNIEKVLETYEQISLGKFTHASPTLYNSSSARPQLSSCFLLHMDDDLEHMYQTASKCALISKYAGGIGIDITKVRAKGSIIHSTNGTSDGIVPMVKVFNQVGIHCNQCFEPSTIIYTKNGPKEIKDVQVEDEVITMDGTYKPVVKVIKNSIKKEILKFRSTYSFEEVKLTKEHQIYTIRNIKKNSVNFSALKNNLIKGKIKPEFCNAGELSDNDFIGFPLQKLPEYDDYKDNEFLRFYGIMLGDGHICSTRNEAGITVNKDSKINTYHFVKKYLDKININYWETESKSQNCVSIRWTNNNSNLVYDDLYDEYKEKRIHQRFMNLTKENRLQLLKGLIETDGSNLKEIYFSSTSYKLAHNIRYLLMSLGIMSSGNIKDERGKTREIRPGEFITNKKISYIVRISKHPLLNEILDNKHNGVYCKYFEYNNIIWSRIRDVQTEEYEGDVYDLSILDNNNYTVGSLGLVHNSGKRKGSIAMYLQPWHPDVLDFLQLRFNAPPEEIRARDIFIAMWVPDIFMRRVEKDEMWSLICPSKCYQLCETYGDDFDKIYEEAEKNNLYTSQIKARIVWEAILKSQEETGLPYMLYKDSVNKKSNQKNIGIIKSSNLCVAPYVKILTKNGYKAIGELENQNVDIWNGIEWSNVKVIKTNTNQEIFRVKTTNHLYIDCTAYHKFPILNDDGISYRLVECKDLKSGMKLLPFNKLEKIKFYNDEDNLKKQYYEFLNKIKISNTDDDSIFSSYTNLSMQFQEEGIYDLNNDTILNVKKTKGTSDVYCVNEPKRNLVMFNGILTGNCTEIMEYTDKDSVAVCNLASIALPKYVIHNDNQIFSYDFKELGRITEMIVENLNLIIDKNFYPVPEAESNNLSYRPIGIGVQGLADTFALLNLPWDSKDAKELNQKIFETIYFHAVKKSNELALKDGSYSAFEGSPISQGILQYHLWDKTEDDLLTKNELDWNSLKEQVKTGMRNSLLVAPMPTASTAQILGNCECFEPITSNIYSRSVLSGDFVCVNKHLYRDLTKINLWNKNIVDKIISNGGSIQKIDEIPKHIKDIYKTVWEIPQRILIDMASDRGAFIDQSQSLNIFIDHPTKAKLSSMHFYGWKKGLKTGSYYIRSKPAKEAVKFTIDANFNQQSSSSKQEDLGDCLMCSS